MRKLKKILESVMKMCQKEVATCDKVSAFDGLFSDLSRFLVETKRNLNKNLCKMSEKALRSKAAAVLEIDRLGTLVDCWIDRFKNDTYIFHLPLDYREIAMKSDLVDLIKQITKIYFLLENISGRDGNFDRRFMRRLQKKGLLEIEENAELFDNEQNGTNQTELLTFQEMQLQVLHHKAIADATVRRKTKFFRRKSRLICIATRTHSQCQETDKDHLLETFDNVFIENSEFQSSLENVDKRTR